MSKANSGAIWARALAVSAFFGSAAGLLAVAGPSGGAFAAERLHAASDIPPFVQAAIDDPERAAFKGDDARRHGAELVAFSRVKPGDAVVELIPGAGYFTRLFSSVAGSKGHVYALWPTQYASEAQKNVADMRALGKLAHYRNVEVVVQPAEQFKMPQALDVVFTSQNFHDYSDKFMAPADPVTFSKQVFAALKPGGEFIVIDHVAEAGSALRDTDTLHRIDPAKVREIVEGAGFKFDGETNILRNPADAHKTTVFDKSIRGHTDQFAYRFKKPG